MKGWPELISGWCTTMGARAQPGVATKEIEAAEEGLQGFPKDLREFYAKTNGLTCGSFAIFPIFREADPKRTWNSIQRANDPKQTPFLEGDTDLLRRFLVIGQVGAAEAALIERANGSLWFESGEEITQTDLDLASFIESCILEQQ